MSAEDVKVKFETLRTMDQTSDSLDMENQMSEHVSRAILSKIYLSLYSFFFFRFKNACHYCIHN